MDIRIKNGVENLAKKTLAIISASTSLLVNQKAAAIPHNFQGDELTESKNETYKRKLRPKLVLKLNPNNLQEGKYIAHSSHSSHSSHASHSSHYSSSYSHDSGSSSGVGIGVIVAGGLIAYGAYQLGKRNKNKN